MEDKQNYKLKYYSSVKVTDVSWLWYPYIPYGKITVVQGDPGEGKSTLMIQLAALLTTGRKMPDGSGDGISRNVIYQAAEDGLSDTVRPRLEEAGADCTKVAFLDLADGMLNLDDSRFEQAILEADAGLLVIDPMQAFLYVETDPNHQNRLRPVLTRMAKVAERTGCAVVLVGHLNKRSGSSKGIYRGYGSIDIAAVARSVLLVRRDTDDPNIRIMTQIKNSLAPEGTGYRFYLDPVNGFHWFGENEYDAEDILSMSAELEETKKDRAKGLIRQLLINGDMASVEIMSNLKEKGIGQRTVQMARAEMKITTLRKNNAWYWHLEKEDE